MSGGLDSRALEIPRKEARRFGILQVNEDERVVGAADLILRSDVSDAGT